MKSEWKDATSYSQGERGKVEPRAWEIKTSAVRITVVRGHLTNPGYWVVHCYELGMNTVDLKLPISVDVETAKYAAINLVENKALDIARDIAALRKLKG